MKSSPHNIDDITADFHERPAGELLLYMIGYASIEWNYCEHSLSTLIWHYVGDTHIGSTVTAKMGNVSRADALLSLARRFEKRRKYLECVEFATKAFNRLREMRNIVMHSHSIVNVSKEQVEWRRASTAAPLGHVGSFIRKEELAIFVMKIKELSFYIMELNLHNFIWKKQNRRTRLPKPFELPQMFREAPQEGLEIRKGKVVRKKLRD